MKKYNFLLGKTLVSIQKIINDEYIQSLKNDFQQFGKILIIIDEKIYAGYFDGFSKLKKDNIEFLIFHSGEKIKTIESYTDLLYNFAKRNLRRDDCVLVIGGGTLSDLVGFAVSTFKRGLNFFIMPTTFLAMIDSSLGGKNGINFQGKNMVGTFYEPARVYINLEFLKSLSSEQIASGMGEVFKYALLNKKFYKYIMQQKIDLDVDFLKKALFVKYKYFRNDKEDKKIRQNLNLGHTFAHAIEEHSNYMIEHGIAVSYGVQLALNLSDKKFGLKNLLDIELLMRKLNIEKNGYKISELLPYMLKDKKNKSDDCLSLILLRDIGKPEKFMITVNELLEIGNGNTCNY